MYADDLLDHHGGALHLQEGDLGWGDPSEMYNKGSNLQVYSKDPAVFGSFASMSSKPDKYYNPDSIQSEALESRRAAGALVNSCSSTRRIYLDPRDGLAKNRQQFYPASSPTLKPATPTIDGDFGDFYDDAAGDGGSSSFNTNYMDNNNKSRINGGTHSIHHASSSPTLRKNFRGYLGAEAAIAANDDVEIVSSPLGFKTSHVPQFTVARSGVTARRLKAEAESDQMYHESFAASEAAAAGRAQSSTTKPKKGRPGAFKW